MTAPWYDTYKGITDAVDAGLGGLHELAKARREAGYKRDERMEEWCVLGKFWLDTRGNFGRIEKGAPSPFRHPRPPDVIPKVLMTNYTDVWTYGVGDSLPPVARKCDRCFLGWGMENLTDFHQDWSHPPRHERCHELQVIQGQIESMQSIIEAADVIKHPVLRAIPNEYDRNSALPWFLVDIPEGYLRIGWRRSVISIDWAGSTLDHDAHELFADEKVPKWTRGIHAHGASKATEYLARLLG